MTTDNSKHEQENLPSVVEVLAAYQPKDAAAAKEQAVEAKEFSSGPSMTDQNLWNEYPQLMKARAQLALEATRRYLLGDDAVQAEVTLEWAGTKEGKRR
jgi:hypothetical protein